MGRLKLPKLLNLDGNLKHVGHSGIVKITEKACDILYWPGINLDLENIVNNVTHVKEYQNQQKDESPIVHDISTTLWTKVGTNLFELTLSIPIPNKKKKLT